MSTNQNPTCARCQRQGYHLNADGYCPECPAIIGAEYAAERRVEKREREQKRNAVRGGMRPVFRDPERQKLARDLARQGIGCVYR